MTEQNISRFFQDLKLTKTFLLILKILIVTQATKCSIWLNGKKMSRMKQVVWQIRTKCCDIIKTFNYKDHFYILRVTILQISSFDYVLLWSSCIVWLFSSKMKLFSHLHSASKHTNFICNFASFCQDNNTREILRKCASVF